MIAWILLFLLLLSIYRDRDQPVLVIVGILSSLLLSGVFTTVEYLNYRQHVGEIQDAISIIINVVGISAAQRVLFNINS